MLRALLMLQAQAVSPEPDVVVVERSGRERFLVVGCDGLWDTLSNEDAAGEVAGASTSVGGHLAVCHH